MIGMMVCFDLIVAYYMFNRFIYQVFKINVQRTEGDNWFVFRRYTDFVRLNEQVSLHLK